MTGTLDLTGSDTVANYQAALASITFYETGDNPTTSRTVSFLVNDGALDSNTATKGIVITPVNDAPVVTTSGGSSAFTEDGGAITVDGSVTVTDPDNANLASATVTISNLLDAGLETLAATTAGTSITANYVAPTLTLSGSDTLAHYQQVLRSVTYNNSSQNPNITARTLSFVANDGALNSTAATKSVTVTAVDDAPVNSVPIGQTVNEDTDLVFNSANSNLISVSDVDAGASAVKVSLDVANGTLTLSGEAGLTFVDATADGTASVHVTGTLSAINTALNGMRYRGTANWNSTRGSESLSVTVNDQGNTGTGGPLSDSDSVAITVAAVGDNPTAAVKSYTFTPNMERTGLSGLLTGATDPDTGDGGYSATFTVNDVTEVGGTCSGGVIANLNSSAGTFDYDPPPGRTTSCTLLYRVNDSGSPTSGTSPYQTITINFQADPVIWFVNPNAGTNGVGTLAHPFNAVASADALSAASQRVFIYDKTPGSTAFSGTFSLNSAEWITGQGAQDALGFDHFMGITPPTGTIARPSINGTAPTLNGGGFTLSSNNNVQGLTFSGTTGTAINGAGINVGTLALADISVNNTTNGGISLTGGGTVTATGTNSITTTSGTALNVSNTTIGASGLTFRSISSNGAANGIVLTSTGTSGGLTITGTGSVGTGGTIQNSTGSGILITTSKDLNLAWMTVSGNGNAGGEDGIRLIEVTGSGGLSNMHVSGSAEDNIYLNDSTGTLSAFSISGASCLITDNDSSIGNTGITVLSRLTANVTVTIDGCSFHGNRSDTIHTDAGDTSTLDATITNNVITQGSPNHGNIGIDVTTAGSATVTFQVDGNKIGTPDGTTESALMNDGINIFNGSLTSPSPASITGTVKNNVVLNDSSFAPGSSNGFGIRVFNQGFGTLAANISGNKVRNVTADYGIFANVASNGGNAAVQGTTTVGVTNNDVSVGTGALDAIRVEARGNSVMNALISGNTTGTHGTGFFGLTVRQANQTVPAGGTVYTPTFNLVLSPTGDYVAPGGIAGVEASLNAQNTISGGSDAIIATKIVGVASVSGIP